MLKNYFHLKNNKNYVGGFHIKMAPAMCFHPQVFWWPFSSPYEGKNKHFEKKQKCMLSCNVKFVSGHTS